MIFLVLAILCSASLNVIFKFSEKRNSNRLAVSFFGFLGATIISLILINPKLFSVFIGELNNVIAQSGSLNSITPSVLALLLGLVNGFLYFGAYYVLQVSTSYNGSAMTATFNKLGVMIPAVLSVVFFHEIPKFLQIIGVITAIAAILIIYLKKEENSVITLKIALFGTLFLGGIADFTSKIYQVFGAEEFQSMFLLFTFLFSLIITGTFLYFKDRNIKRTDIIFGLISGIPAQFVSLFILKALTQVPAFVVFPLYSVGVILVVNIINLLFFKEKLTKRQFIAVGFIIAAVILLNI